MMTHILIDTANMFFRARHVVKGDLDTKVGMSMHIFLNSIKKCVNDFEGTHVVLCLEGRSWRKDVYEPYKKNRKAVRDALTPKEQEEDKVFWEAFDALNTFIKDRTNCTVLQDPTLEADDLIAGWIKLHPDYKHVIVSSDSDFYQLLSENVSQYNGISNQHITTKGIFDDKGNPVIDKKTGYHKQIGDPDYLLFEKCIRGDTSDNVFSAYPGARTKGTKNKIGIQDAYNDMGNKGFTWNNFMLQRWTDHNGEEHQVIKDYERNRGLIDLRGQPEDIKETINDTIVNALKNNEFKTQVGIHFMKFCGKWDLQRVSENASEFGKIFNASYN